jgi:hypothetical protein
LAAAVTKFGDPAHYAKLSAIRKGRVPPPHVMAAAHAANRGRKVSEETRRKMSEAHKRLVGRRKLPNGRAWTADEDAMFQFLTPREVAAKTGRTMESVWQRRRVLGYPDARRAWTADQDALVLSLPPREAAARMGRKVQTVYRRRKQLRRQNVKLADGRKNKSRPPRSK